MVANYKNINKLLEFYYYLSCYLMW